MQLLYRLRDTAFRQHITAVLLSEWDGSVYMEVAITDSRKPAHLGTTHTQMTYSHFHRVFECVGFNN